MITTSCKTYKNEFDWYCAHTDEYRLIVDYILRIITRNGIPCGTVLDIGAGGGNLTLPLSKVFDQVVAIEPNPFYISELHKLDTGSIHVINAHWPTTNIKIAVDIALCVHTMYYIDKNQWTKAIMGMLTLLNPGGVVLIVLVSKRIEKYLIGHIEDTHSCVYAEDMENFLALSDLVFTSNMIVSTVRVKTIHDCYRVLRFLSWNSLHKEKVFPNRLRVNQHWPFTVTKECFSLAVPVKIILPRLKKSTS